MATEIIRYVNTASAGGDGTTNDESGPNAAYTSLGTAASAEAKDLVAADERITFKCNTGSGTAREQNQQNILASQGWTTDATHYITIETMEGDEPDLPWSDTVYRIELINGLSGNRGSVFLCDVPFTRVRGIQAGYTYSAIDYFGNVFQAGGSGDVTFENCVARMRYNNASDGTTTTPSVGFYTQAGTDHLCVNCTVYGENLAAGRHRILTGFRTFGAATMRDYNCTVGEMPAHFTIDGYDLTGGAGTHICVNCVSIASKTVSSGAHRDFRVNIRGRNNCSADAEAANTGVGAVINALPEFIDEAGHNYRLEPFDTYCRDNATDLSADPIFPFNYDFAGTARRGQWDIGAHEAVFSVTPQARIDLAAPTRAAPTPTRRREAIILHRAGSTISMNPVENVAFVPVAQWSRVRVRVAVDVAGVRIGLIWVKQNGQELGPGERAWDRLTLTGQPLNNETVTLGGFAYTFQTTLTDVNRNVQIGATARESIENLVAAVNLEAGAGTKYAASTTLNTSMFGVLPGLTARAEFYNWAQGENGSVSETLTNGAFDNGGGSLTGFSAGDIAADATQFTGPTTFEIPSSEHVGEEWLKVCITNSTGPMVVTHFEVSGD